MDKARILWLANIPSPYRVDFFNEFGKHCDLTVVFERHSSSERDDSWKEHKIIRFRAVFLRGMSIGSAEAFCPEIVRYINRTYQHIVVTTYSDPTGLMAIAYMKSKGITYCIEGDGAFPTLGNGYKEILKRWAISNARLCFSSCKNHDRYYEKYSAQKIVRYPFTSVREGDLVSSPKTTTEKMSIRKGLGVVESRVVISVGQFIPRKGYDILIEAANILSRDIGFYLIGGIPPEDYCLMKTEYGLNNVHFIPFKRKSELRAYYQMADLFVHPCREDIWGLVINEAMANALPVVSTCMCNAALEMVDNDANGLIIQTESVRELAEAIMVCLGNEKMAENNIKLARQYTIEKMSKKHEEVLLGENK